MCVWEREREREREREGQTDRDREQLIKSVSNANLNVTVICQQHWPSNFDNIEVHGKILPKNPPSVWPGVPSS